MSLESWIAEFVPSDPESCTSTWTEALTCSIRIWTGKLSENIRKHRLKSEPGAACPLCIKDTIMQTQAESSNKGNPNDCDFCPIMLSTGETCSRIYLSPNSNKRVKKMLQILNKAQEYVNTHPECEEI